MKNRNGHWLALLTALAFVGFMGAPAPLLANLPPDAEDDEITLENRPCLRCHGMPGLAERDANSGALVNYHVDADALAASSHNEMACNECHGSGFKIWPHAAETKMETRQCADCHIENSKFDRRKFEKIEREFNRSVHFQLQPETFDCFACHDPHTLQRLTNKTVDLGALVTLNNGVCIDCHPKENQVSPMSGKPIQGLNESHRWLPNAGLHWDAVRCIECHSPEGRDGKEVSHIILGKDHAERECIACHAKEAPLLNKLYKHRVLEERQTAGFLNSAVLNDAYIIGMTRNQPLDRAGLLLVGLTFFGVLGHGLGRYIANRRRNHDRQD